jgi:DNA-binding HxlR family transcriptional regulator
MALDNFCPIAAATDLLGQRWTLLIIHFLHEAAPSRLRFCQLQDKLGGLNPSTLSQRLKLLEAEGLVKRVEAGTLPLHVEYSLTRKGRELDQVVEGLSAWGSKWLAPAAKRKKTAARKLAAARTGL